MRTLGEPEFVNRGAELAFLAESLRGPGPALIIITSPAGYGKSRLTDQLAATYRDRALIFCVVDPSIRAAQGGAQLHDGFFLQRCAEALNRKAPQMSWPTLGQFLRNKKWKAIRTKSPLEVVSELPSLSHGYKLAFDYASRVFGFGRFSPDELLVSDQADAIAICRSYVEDLIATRPLVMIVREAHHIDLESLRTLLRVYEDNPHPDLILEYTTEKGELQPDHQKLILRTAELRTNFSILDLVRLEPGHLEYLIKRTIRDNFKLSSDYYLSWNGNLRSVFELKFRAGIGRHLTGKEQIGRALGNLSQTLEEHISELSPFQRVVLAVVLAHVEAIDSSTLSHAIASIDAEAGSRALRTAISELQNVHGFLGGSASGLSIQNETIAIALRASPMMQGPLALSEKTLRDYYSALIDNSAYGSAGLASAVRQVFRLCARTKDAAGLQRAIGILSEEVKRAQDQSVYIDVISAAISADPDLYKNDHDDLLLWAASLAYDTCDWGRVVEVLSSKPVQEPFTMAMFACALQEIGRHDDALSFAIDLQSNNDCSDAAIAGKLIEALIIGCRGEHDGARACLMDIVEGSSSRGSALVGYAHRFFEIIDGFIESLPHLQSSIDSFESVGFIKSKAYSQLPAAMFYARCGQVEQGRRLIREARQVLAGQVCDQHTILNNLWAVELLADEPDFSGCRQGLLSALKLARDDFTDLTILTNLSLAFLGERALPDAIRCAERCMQILERHDFADKDIYWPVCFNAGQVFAAAGYTDRRNEVLEFPHKFGMPISVNRPYWQFRYGETTELDDCYRFLASRPRHPVYLSHWLIDLEGLSLLRQRRQQ